MLIATPNPCLDITVRLAALVPGTVSRATRTLTTAGGKGVNVARAAAALGETGLRFAAFLPSGDGARYAELLAAEGTPLLPVEVDGVTRVATIFLEDSGRVTVVNGRGPEIDENSWQRFRDLVVDALRPGDVLVCSGSLPPGVPVDGYGQLTRIAHRAGCRAVVDASPAVLAAALPAGPDVVSPNLAEAEGLLYGRADEQVDEVGDDIPERAIAAARELHAAGAELAVVTAGGTGAGFADAAGGGWIPSPQVSVVNPIGAGDAFAAAAAGAVGRGLTGVDVVRYAMAAASASCEQELAGWLNAGRAADLLVVITAAGVQRLLPDRDIADLEPNGAPLEGAGVNDSPAPLAATGAWRPRIRPGRRDSAGSDRQP
jgi:1-phosphofructokinase family hexose kinase